MRSPLAIALRDEILSDAWQTLDELAARVDAPRRDVETAVEELRLAGDPVIGGAHGVRWSRDPDEIRAYVRSRRRRELTVARGTRALMATARRLDTTELTLGLTA